MHLIINNKWIRAPVIAIMKQLAKEVPGKIKILQDKGTNVAINCPVHNDGNEKHSSCQIYADINGDTEYGKTHCFACGLNISLYELVNIYFEQKGDFGKEWLCERFGVPVSFIEVLPEITLKPREVKCLNEDILNKFQDYHPYMEQRKLTLEVIKRFKIKYDHATRSIVFPVWDQHGKLVMLTRRSVIDKTFYIDKDIEKPVYLLHEIIKNSITKVHVCESQINALTLWGWGIPAIALIGTGSNHQYEILKKSGIREYILCFDGDAAGEKGADRFKKHMPKNVLISNIQLPPGKDINDLTFTEFTMLEPVY